MKLLALITAFAIGYFVGVYVERTYTSPQTPLPAAAEESGTASDNATSETDNPADTANEAVPLPTDRLSESQKRMLTSFGLDPATITVTAAMIACAKEKISTARYEEILSGATPTFNESLSFLACYRQ